jgi:hypothetical protein
MSFEQNCSLVIQGPYDDIGMSFIRNYENEKVISTWTHDVCKIGDLHGSNYKIIAEPLPDVSSIFNPTNFYYQCKSTLNGLKFCTKEYVIKVRFDEFFSNLHKVYEKALEVDKLIFLPIFFRKADFYPYHPSDHVICGKRSVLIEIYEECIRRCETFQHEGRGPETCFFTSFLSGVKKIEINNDPAVCRILMKECCDILHMNEVAPFIVNKNVEGPWVNNCSFQVPQIDVVNSINEL